MTGQRTLTDLAMRYVVSLLACVVLAAQVGAADPGGSYRLTADFPVRSITVLVSFAPLNGQWTGQYLGGPDVDALKPAVRDVRVGGDRFRFTLVIAGEPAIFDGKLAAGRGPIPGSLTAGETIIPVTLEPSALAKYDRTGLLKEIAATAAPGPLFYDAVIELLSTASSAKASTAEVKSWTERAAKAAVAQGARWQMHILLRMAGALSDQPAHAAVALDLVRRADQLLDPADEVGVQLTVLDLLRRLLLQAHDSAAVDAVQVRIDALAARDFRDYVAASPVKPDPFGGRKAASKRVALVELFVGVDDPPSVAAELAFDALSKLYKASEVVRLQYYPHQPDPDPIANKSSEARWVYYQTWRPADNNPLLAPRIPAVFVNGRAGPVGGGPAEVATAKLKQYRAMIEPQLETPAGAGLQLSAHREGDKLTITAKVTGLTKPGDKVRLRLALAESVIRYRGGNGVRYHQCVVRGFAGLPDGIPLPKAEIEYQAVVDLAALRAGLVAELRDLEKKNAGVTFPDPPLGLRSFVVVGFVQNDLTHEVLQAGQVEAR
jgi:hypothetical protein